jgi:hypothetical protein
MLIDKREIGRVKLANELVGLLGAGANPNAQARDGRTLCI